MLIMTIMTKEDLLVVAKNYNELNSLYYSIKYLNPGDEPKCKFDLSDDEELKAVYAYCNLHGLWVNNK